MYGRCLKSYNYFNYDPGFYQTKTGSNFVKILNVFLEEHLKLFKLIENKNGQTFLIDIRKLVNTSNSVLYELNSMPADERMHKMSSRVRKFYFEGGAMGFIGDPSTHVEMYFKFL